MQSTENFSRCDLVVVTGTLVAAEMDQNNQPTPDCGDFSGGIPPYSVVGYSCVMMNGQYAFNVVINNSNDEAAALQ